jgi:tetratricopeptide (TPR) repeat protein
MGISNRLFGRGASVPAPTHEQSHATQNIKQPASEADRAWRENHPCFINESEPIQGEIGYFKLTDWWMTAFSDRERKHIESIFHPISTIQASGSPLTSGVIQSTTETAVGFLSALAGWFQKPEDRTIAHRILNKAMELSKDASALDNHYLYQTIIQFNYRNRENGENLKAAIDACLKMISLAPEAARAYKSEFPKEQLPGHKGYEQLAIIYEKQGRFQDAIAVSEQAANQHWGGDWAKRIERCGKKLMKA